MNTYDAARDEVVLTALYRRLLVRDGSQYRWDCRAREGLTDGRLLEAVRFECECMHLTGARISLSDSLALEVYKDEMVLWKVSGVPQKIGGFQKVKQMIRSLFDIPKLKRFELPGQLRIDL